jgi:hypothetical protein
MKMSIAPLSFIVSAAIALASCGNSDESSCSHAGHDHDGHDHDDHNHHHAEEGVSYYGEVFEAEADKYNTFNGNVDSELAHYFEGEIVESCQTMGCWMTVKNENGDTNMVKMLSHDFFVPKQGLGGLNCRVHGHILRDTVDVEQRKHYAFDAGKSQEEIDAITEPSFELSFVAYGVEIDGVVENENDEDAHTAPGE